MKASEVRRLSQEHTLFELQAAVEALAEREEETLPVEGDDPGERLTNLLLATRVRERIDEGEEPKVAFRAVMQEVRDMAG